MPYILHNRSGNTGFVCPDGLWLAAIDAAKERGWRPEGTRFDFAYTVDRDYDCRAGTMSNMFTVITIHMDHLNWNGSYTEKLDQLVGDADAADMAAALTGTPGMEDLAAFIAKGGFRIMSE
ncbi:MAG: hypothetical protein MUD12_04335 [Spirochaetes bacterium]|jgi:hypothetical protein|nr:hypothetical protein [Spirochaetota bacterium]